MKKLMIIAAVVCAALASQAASFDWKTYTGQNVYAMNASDKVSGTAYLFDASVYTVNEVIEAFAADTFSTLTTIDSSTVASGVVKAKIAESEVINMSVEHLDAFFAIVQGDNIFVSGVAGVDASDLGNASIVFKGLTTPSKLAATEWTSGMTATTGWYTAAVPEPTSGLLVLIGMAGLALRRRCA